MKNKQILCKNCNRTFIVPEWEQKVYRANGKPLPTCCSTCRKERREQERANKNRFTESDYYHWIGIMTNRIPARRDTKHPTDDFRGFMKSRVKIAL